PPPRSVSAVPGRPGVPRWLSGLMISATLLFVLAAAFGLGRLGPGRGPSPGTPTAAQSDKALALEFMRQGSPAKAIELLDGMVTRDPGDAEAHILKQNALAQLIGRPVIRLPVLTSATGPDGLDGVSLLHGVALAQAEVNQAGGPGSRSLVVDVYDDQSQLPRGLALAQEIAERADYLVCVGPFNSQFTLGVEPLFNHAGLAFIAPVASDPGIWEAGPYIFTGSDSNLAREEVLARHFLSRHLKRGAILYDPDSLYSINMAEEFAEFLKEHGGEATCRVPYQEGAIQQVVESRPQFVFLADYRTRPLVEQLQALRRAGLKVPVAAQARLFNHELIRGLGAEAEGLLLSAYFHPDLPDPMVQEFTRHFHQMFGELQPSHREATAYDVVKLTLPALERPDATRRTVRDYLAGLDSYTGVTGTFAPGRRLDRRKAYVIEIRQGRFELLP
ncbi:MAG: ABC transporter substrate-binding protein, partial [Candidatus Eremiobacterota bacterium]